MMLLSSSVRDQGKDLEKKFLSFQPSSDTDEWTWKKKKNKNYGKLQNLNL